MLRKILAAFAVVLLATASTLVPGDTIADEPPDLPGRQFPWTNGFGYQGRLTIDGVPANGTFNFQFLLYDDAVAGMQVESTHSQTLPVANGVFNTQLFFDEALNSGDEYWVEVRVKQPADGGYTLLNPRQQLLPAPYAQIAAGLPPESQVDFSDYLSGFGAFSLTQTTLIAGIVGSNAAPFNLYGIGGHAIGDPSLDISGGKFTGSTQGVFAESDTGYGIRAESKKASRAAVLGVHDGVTCIGTTGELSLDQYCYGVAGIANVSTTHGIGVYGFGSNTSVWGVAYTPSTWSGYFSVGDVGLGAGVTVVNASDRNLKRDIEPLGAGLEELLRLKPASYAWKSQPDSNERDFGFIAQDVQEVLPGLVSTTREGDLALDYNGFIPVIVSGVQELEGRVSTLESGSAPSTMAQSASAAGITRGVLALFAAGMLGAAVVGGVTGAFVTRRR